MTSDNTKLGYANDTLFGKIRKIDFANIDPTIPCKAYTQKECFTKTGILRHIILSLKISIAKRRHMLYVANTGKRNITWSLIKNSRITHIIIPAIPIIVFFFHVLVIH